MDFHIKRSVVISLIVSLFLGCGGEFKSQISVPPPDSPPKQKTDTPPPPDIPPKEQDRSFFLVQDQRQAEVPSYQAPKAIQERLNTENPDFLPPHSAAFSLNQPTLVINVKKATMIFSGLLKVSGSKDEKIELKCSFDVSKDWMCGNMFPTDESVARERRIQASVNCDDNYNCDWVAIQLFILINGKIESQFFQTRGFEMRLATSGDAPEESVAPPKDIKVLEKPVQDYKAPETLVGRVISEKEFEEILDDANMAVDIQSPIVVPEPDVGSYSIPAIANFHPPTDTQVRNQAVGAHNRGRLNLAAKLPQQGQGFFVRSGKDRSFGTDSMVGLIQTAAEKMAKDSPGQNPVAIADISQERGGRLSNRSGRYHASHQTGLDADIAFPLKEGANGDLWPACQLNSKGRCNSNGGISKNLDERRLWALSMGLVCDDKTSVIAIFIDSTIKSHMCRWAREHHGDELQDTNSCAFRTLRAMKHSSGHHNHIHVRIPCPGNRDCRNATVGLGKGTGC